MTTGALVSALALTWLTQEASPQATDSPQPEQRLVIERVEAIQGGTFQVRADRHCIYLQDREAAPAEGVLAVRLGRGLRYRVSVSGTAFASTHTGRSEDPLPGVMIYYATGEEDGIAARCELLSDGDEVVFTSSGSRSAPHLRAFFVDYTPNSRNRGAVTLKLERAPTAPEVGGPEALGRTLEGTRWRRTDEHSTWAFHPNGVLDFGGARRGKWNAVDRRTAIADRQNHYTLVFSEDFRTAHGYMSGTRFRLRRIVDL